MPDHITWKNIGRQLKADLIGKDSCRGVTLTYSWLANQFGHFALGCIPTIILYNFFSRNYRHDLAASRSAFVVAILVLVLETGNFLGPLLSKKRSKSRLLFIKGSPYIFKPDWFNIGFDTWTDILFFWFGACFGSLLCAVTIKILIFLLLTAGALVYPGYYWFLTKMYIQSALYPFQFRLSQWDVAGITNEDKATVARFLNNKDTGMHLFIIGANGSCRTSLAVGIATELAIRHKTSIYITAMKLYHKFFDEDEKENKDLWNWRTASVLLIDDVNPGDPIKDDFVSPNCFLHFLDTFTYNQQNRDIIKNANVIWVLGNEDPGERLIERWQEMLEGIGVKRERILSIALVHPSVSEQVSLG